MPPSSATIRGIAGATSVMFNDATSMPSMSPAKIAITRTLGGFSSPRCDAGRLGSGALTSALNVRKPECSRSGVRAQDASDLPGLHVDRRQLLLDLGAD